MSPVSTSNRLREHGWLIETDEREVPADGLSSTVPSVSIGETSSWEFRFYPTGYHLEGTYSADPEEHLDRYEELLSYKPHSGHFVVESSSLEARARYREQHTDNSLLVKVYPVSENPSTSGIWGLIEAIEDGSMQPTEVATLQVNIVYLAEADEYDDHAAVRQDLESRGP